MKRKRKEPVVVEARTSTLLSDVVTRPSDRPAWGQKKPKKTNWRHQQSEGEEATRTASAFPEGSARKPWAKKPKKTNWRQAPGEEDEDRNRTPSRSAAWKKAPRRSTGNDGEDGSPDDAPKKERKPRQRPSALVMAVGMLARREHSQAELLKKLMLREVPEDEARAAIERLVEENLQSDQRFLESRVRIKLSAGHGPRRAQHELSSHGLAEEAVENAVDARDDKWQDAAYDLLERRYGPSPIARDFQTKAFNLLLRRGFTQDQAWTALRQPRPDKDDTRR